MARFGILFELLKPQFLSKVSMSCGTQWSNFRASSRLLSNTTPIESSKFQLKEAPVFEDTFENVVQCLTIRNSDYVQLQTFYNHFKEVLEYNVPHGKKIRGKTMVAAYKMLHKNPNSISEDDQFRLQILGWCVEMVQAFLLMADDLMDQSHTRRGQPCWFRKEHIGLAAFNDAVMIEYGIFKILREHFGDQPYYSDVVDLFTTMYLITCMGQSIDLHSCYRPNTATGFKRFTMENYSLIVKHKTAWYSFYFPIALAMQLNKMTEPSLDNHVKEILLQIGHLFQVQDDYIDCYGVPAVTGKLGTDIEDGKCSWLAVTALEAASNQQIQVMKENYAKPDTECVQKVKNLYLELQVAQIYENYERNVHDYLISQIDRVSSVFPRSIFDMFISQIYKRRA